MRSLSFAFLILFSLPTAAETPADSKEGFPARLEALHSRTATAHSQLGAWATSKKIHELAWREYRRAAALDPENAEAQKAHGRRKEGEKWVDDPKLEVRKRNEGVPEVWQKFADEYVKKRAALGSKAAKDYEGAAQSAAKAGLEAEAKALWRELLRWYDAKNEKANLALGFVRDGDAWVGARDAAARAEAAKRIPAASAGKDVEGKSEIQRALGWQTARRRSEHFLIEARLSAEETGQLVQFCEAARAEFLSVFKFRDEDFPDEIQGVMPSTTEEYETYIDCLPGLSADTRERRKYDGWARSYKKPYCWMAPGTSAEMAAARDAAIHHAAHFLAWRGSSGGKSPPDWLDEGIALWLTDRLNKTGRSYCTTYYKTDEGRQLTDPLKWRRIILEALRDERDPQLIDVMSGEMTSLAGLRAVKAWSLVDWLISAHRDDLIAAWADLRGGEDLSKALFVRLGVKDYAGMNELWVKWVDENY